MPAVSVDTIAVEAMIASLRRAVVVLESIADGVAADEAAAALDAGRSTLLYADELVEEVSLAARMLSQTVDDATAADLLASSLTDDIGAVPVDLTDPSLVTHYLDDDDALALGHFGHFPLFGDAGVPRPSDVRQGGIGDCGVMAALAALVTADPEAVRRLVTDHGNGTYTVHLATGDVTVDDQLPYVIGMHRTTYARQGASGALWPAIVEKALAVANGGYEALDGLGAANAFSGLTASTDSIASTRDPGLDDADVAELDRRLDEGAAAVALSDDAFGFGEGHAWTVVAVAGTGAAASVTLRNPWGRLGMERDEDGDVVYDADHLDVDGEEVLGDEDDDGFVLIGPASPYVTVPADVFIDEFFAVQTADPG